MRWNALATLGLILITAIPRTSSAAEEARRVAILPPEVYGDRDLAGLRSGLADLLASKIAAGDRVEVVSSASVEAALGGQAGKPLDDGTVERVAKALGASAVVWGSLTTLGRSTSVVLKLTTPGDRGRTKHFSAIAGGQDAVLARLGALGDEIRGVLVPEAVAPPSSLPAREERAASPREPVLPPPATAAPSLPQATAAKAGGLFPFQGSNVWTSDDLPYGVRGMAVGDVDGDGRQEIVLIDQTTVYLYRLEGQRLVSLATARGENYENYISVSVDAPVAGMSQKILVTSMRERPHSYEIGFKGGALVRSSEDLPFYLRRVEGGGRGEVLGQEMQGTEWPFRGDIFRMAPTPGGLGYVRGEKVDLPKGFALYNFGTADLTGDGREEYVAVNGDGSLLLYSPTKEYLGRGGRDGYGASCVGWRSLLRKGDADSTTQQTITIAPPLVAADLEGDGAQELVAVRNPAGGLLSLLTRSASSGAQIEGLKWSGGRLKPVGTLDAVGACVVGLSWADLRGDGSRELVAATVVNPDAAIESVRSALYVYFRE